MTKRDAKTVLDRLCGDGPERSRQLLQAPIALLRDRGKENGLCGFCDEVTERLAPLFLLA